MLDTPFMNADTYANKEKNREGAKIESEAQLRYSASLCTCYPAVFFQGDENKSSTFDNSLKAISSYTKWNPGKSQANATGVQKYIENESRHI